MVRCVRLTQANCVAVKPKVFISVNKTEQKELKYRRVGGEYIEAG